MERAKHSTMHFRTQPSPNELRSKFALLDDSKFTFRFGVILRIIKKHGIISPSASKAELHPTNLN